MSALDFLSPDLASEEAVWRSPLEGLLEGAPPGIRDVSRTGKLELRGEIDMVDLPYGCHVVRITPSRALVLCPYSRTARVRASLERQARFVVDLTAALAGLELRGERLLRRLTDLDLERLPAPGPVAHVPAFVTREGDRFRVFFPQEYGRYLCEVVLDAAEGLGR